MKVKISPALLSRLVAIWRFVTDKRTLIVAAILVGAYQLWWPVSYYTEALYKPFRVAVWSHAEYEKSAAEQDSRIRYDKSPPSWEPGGGIWPEWDINGVALAKNGRWLLIASNVVGIYPKVLWPRISEDGSNNDYDRNTNSGGQLLYWVDTETQEVMPVMNGPVWDDFIAYAKQPSDKVDADFRWTIIRQAEDGELWLALSLYHLEKPKNIEILDWLKLPIEQRDNYSVQGDSWIIADTLKKTGAYNAQQIKQILDDALGKDRREEYKNLPNNNYNFFRRESIAKDKAYQVYRWTPAKRVLEPMGDSALTIDGHKIPWGTTVDLRSLYSVYVPFVYTNDGNSWLLSIDQSILTDGKVQGPALYYHDVAKNVTQRVRAYQEETLVDDSFYQSQKKLFDRDKNFPPAPAIWERGDSWPACRYRIVHASKKLDSAVFQLTQNVNDPLLNPWYWFKSNKDVVSSREFLAKHFGKDGHMRGVSPDGNFLLLGVRDVGLITFDVKANTSFVWPKDIELASENDFSPNFKYSVTTEHNQRVVLHDMDSGKSKVIISEKTPQNYVEISATTYSNDGCTIALTTIPLVANAIAPGVKLNERLCAYRCTRNVIVGRNPFCK